MSGKAGRAKLSWPHLEDTYQGLVDRRRLACIQHIKSPYTASGLWAMVDLRAVIYVEDVHGVGVIVDAIHHPVGTALCAILT